MTQALRLLAVVVAFIGVWSALMALQVERTRELATLTTLGLGERQQWALGFLETGLMGAVAGLLALPLGWLLAFILVDVINVRSFGWTMRLEADPWLFAQAFLVERRRGDAGLGLPAAAPAAAVAGRGAEAGVTVIPRSSGPRRRGLRRPATRPLAALASSPSPSPWPPPPPPRTPPATAAAGRPRLELGPGPDLSGFARATAVRPFVLPADHGPHFEYQTEWWYYTGNLAAADGRRFGFQLTFFRRGLSPGPPPDGPGLASNQVYFAHFAITDVAARPPRRGRALLARRGRPGRRDGRAVRRLARGLEGGVA